MRAIFSKLVWSAALCLAVIGVVAGSAATTLGSVYVEYGQNLGSTVPKRINYLLGKAGVVVNTYAPDVETSLQSDSLILSFGNATLSNTFVSLSDVKAEGFRIKSQVYTAESTLIASNGQPIAPNGHEFAMNLDAVHYGAVVGAYAVLEQLGFSFLHPMDPMIPTKLFFPLTNGGDISTTESPYWPTRTWHIHTQHPLEFTEVLNGFDIPMFAKVDDADADVSSADEGNSGIENKKKEKITTNDKTKHSTTTATTTTAASATATAATHACLPNMHCETWDSMFSTLDGLFEWFAANRQNRVEVLLLGSPKWDAYNDLTTGSKRQSRLTKINDLAHEFGILIGADIPIANRQQHGWKMISLADNFTQQSADIEARVDWAFAAQYDFISTESGLSEFTKPSCDLMLSLFQVFTQRGE